MNKLSYRKLKSENPPEALTINRLESLDELILAQTTSQCCRFCCTQKSINWTLAQQDNFPAGTDPFEIQSGGWIHEESSLSGRMLSFIFPGSRATKYVQHSGPLPESLQDENSDWCTVQSQNYPMGLSEEQRQSDIVATHEKDYTCGTHFGNKQFPLCNFFPLPYLESKKSNGTVIGRTVYICDGCFFIPKFDVLDSDKRTKFHIRPDTCFFGCCVRCRCDGSKNCLRIPFVIRDLDHNAIESNKTGTLEERSAKVDHLWSGWKNEVCSKRDAYHIIYPKSISAEDKLLLIGSGLLIDFTLFEQKQDND